MQTHDRPVEVRVQPRSRIATLSRAATAGVWVLVALLMTPLPAVAHFGRGHALDVESLRAHAEHGVGYLMWRLGASAEQTTQLNAIVAELIGELWPIAEEHRANRDAWVAALAGPTVDRDALEALRRSELALAERASLELTDALARASEALTPEQRTRLVALVEQHRAHR